MSDFLYSSSSRAPGALRKLLETYLDPVSAGYAEYHGEWGSLAIARGAHDPRVVEEDDRFLSVLIGEPVIRIAPDSTGIGGSKRRRALHELLRADRNVSWDRHLDGPFAVLVVDKRQRTGRVISDLMAFIPVFSALSEPREGVRLVLGTHVDVVAGAARKHHDFDPVSAADLVINGSITFPRTLYPGVEQIAPGGVRGFDARRGWVAGGYTYWQPLERDEFGSVREAAAALREGFAEDIRVVCEGNACVGLLLSAGEDSRVVLGAIPSGVETRAFIFADWENREVGVARKVARAYGAGLTFGRRHPEHYLQWFEPVAAAIGSQHRFMDLHGYMFHDTLGIRELPVVLGGYSSDALLKAQYATAKAAGTRPPKRLSGENNALPVPGVAAIREELLQEIANRREQRHRQVMEVRPGSAGEWFHLWPFSMRRPSANLHGNRRLFHIHEPFMSNAVVKLAASVPQTWKRNRRLFHHAMRPFLTKSWYIPHARARFPFFGFYSNLALGAGVKLARNIHDGLTGTLGVHQGGWPETRELVRSGLMARKSRQYSIWDSPVRCIFEPGSPDEIERAVREEWSPNQQFLLLELAFLSRRARNV